MTPCLLKAPIHPTRADSRCPPQPPDQIPHRCTQGPGWREFLITAALGDSYLQAEARQSEILSVPNRVALLVSMSFYSVETEANGSKDREDRYQDPPERVRPCSGKS